MVDVFPRRDLGAADDWGRQVEDRLRKAVQKSGAQIGEANGENRAGTSRISTLSRQADNLEAALLALPEVRVSAATASNFGLSDGWNTVASTNLSFLRSGTIRLNARASVTIQDNSPTPTPAPVVWPFDLSTVTSEYGPRPPLPFHRGIDFGIAGGTPIPSASTGTVILKGFYADDWGNYIRVDCSAITGIPGSWLGYAHLQEPAPWNVGDTIYQGQTVGLVGTTGLSTGNHLHFETAPGGDRINPRDFMAVFGVPGTSSGSAVQTARLVMAGAPTLEFGFTVGNGFMRQMIPIGAITTSGSSADVLLQVRASASVPAAAINSANLSVRAIRS